jgi:dienelactone hydrolase
MSSIAVEHVHEGTTLVGRMAVPRAQGPSAGVLVMHNAHGLGPHMIEIADRLCDHGYVALATDMYGAGAYHEDRQRAGQAIAPLWSNPRLLRSRVVSWLACLKARPEVDPSRVAAIGYCFGGQCVLELARSGADLKAVISFHGLLKTTLPAEEGKIKAHVAAFTGARDPYVPAADVQSFREEMLSARAHWQITEFGSAYHAFTDYRLPTEANGGIAFDPLAESVSWSATLELLKAAM